MSKQKLIAGPIKGYKGTDENMCCRGFQYQLGENILDNKNDLVLYKNGFHFCQQPSGPFCWGDYSRLWEIEAYDVLESDFEAGADYKQICRKIVFKKEVKITGDKNTGDKNTGDKNTGDGNTGNMNTGSWNTGVKNAGARNTGARNTGDMNTGNMNIGDGNTGFWNTGNRNTGHGNATDRCAGHFCLKEQPLIFFDLPTKQKEYDIDWVLAYKLIDKLRSKADFDCTPFLSLPNATKSRIKKLHKRHLELLKKGGEK